MKIDVITLFPEALQAMTGLGVTGSAIRDGKVDVRALNPRDFALDRHRSVDDRPYGGGPGMVMTVEPLRSAVRAARAHQAAGTRVSLLSPQGRKLDQAAMLELAARPGLILLCGRYEGVDERLVDLEVDEEWSIGDYVLSGGEIPALLLVDAVVRLLPGVLGHEDSAAEDSFAARGPAGERLLEGPQYTRPRAWDSRFVPDVLVSGDHKAVREWRMRMMLDRTRRRRPDLLGPDADL